MEDFTPGQPNLNSLKLRARKLLAGVPGVRGIGFSWDDAGNSILQIDLAPSTDLAAVERRLSPLDTSVRFRQIRGTVKGE